MKQAMTIDECVERLNLLRDTDPETAHSEADYLLCDALLALKANTVVDAYLKAKHQIRFSYAR